MKFRVQSADVGLRIGKFVQSQLKKDSSRPAHVPMTLLFRLFRQKKILVENRTGSALVVAKHNDTVQRGQTIVIDDDTIRNESVSGRESSSSPSSSSSSSSSLLTEQTRDYVRGMVLYENKDVFVLNKPAGLAVQGGSKVKVSLDDLLPALASQQQQQQQQQEVEEEVEPKLLHRLDQDVSGVLLVAKNRLAAATYSKLFRSPQYDTRRQSAAGIRKLYWSLCAGVPHPLAGRIRLPLEKRWINNYQQIVPRFDLARISSPKAYLTAAAEKGHHHTVQAKGGAMRLQPIYGSAAVRTATASSRRSGDEEEEVRATRSRVEDVKMAVSEYAVIHAFGSLGSLVQLQAITGRTHQLRAHCAMSLECPIVGDRKYSQYNDKCKHLHSSLLEGLQHNRKALPLHLHAVSIQFPLLTADSTQVQQQYCTVSCPPPDYFWHSCDRLGFDLGSIPLNSYY